MLTTVLRKWRQWSSRVQTTSKSLWLCPFPTLPMLVCLIVKSLSLLLSLSLFLNVCIASRVTIRLSSLSLFLSSYLSLYVLLIVVSACLNAHLIVCLSVNQPFTISLWPPADLNMTFYHLLVRYPWTSQNMSNPEETLVALALYKVVRQPLPVQLVEAYTGSCCCCCCWRKRVIRLIFLLSSLLSQQFNLWKAKVESDRLR